MTLWAELLIVGAGGFVAGGCCSLLLAGWTARRYLRELGGMRKTA